MALTAAAERATQLSGAAEQTAKRMNTQLATAQNQLSEKDKVIIRKTFHFIYVLYYSVCKSLIFLFIT